MRNKIQLLLITGVFFTSCSSVAHLQTDDLNQNYAETNPNNIEVYSTDKIEKEYNVIGEVIASADAGSDGAISVKHLKREAAKLGADGIINLRLEVGYGYWSNAIKASGTAIKYVKL